MRTSRKFSTRLQPHQTWLFSRRNVSCTSFHTLVVCCVHDPFAKSRAMYLWQEKTARTALCVQPALWNIAARVHTVAFTQRFLGRWVQVITLLRITPKRLDVDSWTFYSIRYPPTLTVCQISGRQVMWQRFYGPEPTCLRWTLHRTQPISYIYDSIQTTAFILAFYSSDDS